MKRLFGEELQQEVSNKHAYKHIFTRRMTMHPLSKSQKEESVLLYVQNLQNTNFFLLST